MGDPSSVACPVEPNREGSTLACPSVGGSIRKPRGPYSQGALNSQPDTGPGLKDVNDKSSVPHTLLCCASPLTSKTPSPACRRTAFLNPSGKVCRAALISGLQPTHPEVTLQEVT